MSLLLKNEDGGLVTTTALEKYTQVMLLPCDNPFCSCDEGILYFQDSEKKRNQTYGGIPFAVSVVTKKLTALEGWEPTDDEQEDFQQIKPILENQLTDEDWTLIQQNYRDKKADLIATTTNFETLPYQYHFNEAFHLSKSLLVSFKEVFPQCKLFKLTKDGVTYEVVAQYCKNIKCDCTEVNLEFFKVGQPERGVFDFFYDYKAKKIDDDQYKWAIEQLQENYPDLDELLEIRALKVKTLFGYDKLRRTKALMAEKKTGSLKIGRNTPCPCGSGKKYKQCCLKKQ